jgi:hypothetical protein
MDTLQQNSSQELAKIQYLKWTDDYLTKGPYEKYTIGEPTSNEIMNLVFEDKDILVKDIRGHEKDFSLDGNGFIVRNFAKGAASLADQKVLPIDDATIQKLYLPLIDEFLKAEVEGVDRVFPFNWRVGQCELYE